MFFILSVLVDHYVIRKRWSVLEIHRYRFAMFSIPCSQNDTVYWTSALTFWREAEKWSITVSNLSCDNWDYQCSNSHQSLFAVFSTMSMGRMICENMYNEDQNLGPYHLRETGKSLLLILYHSMTYGLNGIIHSKPWMNCNYNILQQLVLMTPIYILCEEFIFPNISLSSFNNNSPIQEGRNNT